MFFVSVLGTSSTQINLVEAKAKFVNTALLQYRRLFWRDHFSAREYFGRRHQPARRLRDRSPTRWGKRSFALTDRERCDVPKPHRAVSTDRNERLGVRRERSRGDPRRMGIEAGPRPPGRRVPSLGDSVGMSRGERPAGGGISANLAVTPTCLLRERPIRATKLPNEGQSAFMELGAAVANRNDVSGVRDWRKALNDEILFRRIR
jgi:hypothetical protein